MPREPLVDHRCLVGPVVVQNDMDVLIGGHRLVDGAQKLDELDRAMPLVALREHFAGRHVQGGEQRRGPVPSVVVCAPFRQARAHRQHRLGTVQGLHLRLLVDAQDHGTLGRMQVQADDIAHFLDEQRVLRQLEGLAAVGLQGERPPDAADRRRTHPAQAGHRACTPVRGVAGHRFQGGGHHALHVRVRHRPRRAGASFIQQAITTGLEKPAAPLTDGHPRRAQLGGYRRIALPRGAGQHDSGAQGQRLGGLGRRTQRSSSSR